MFFQLYKSFRNAIRGIVFCIKNERNFRIHIVALFYVFFFSVIYGLEEIKLAIIFAVFSLVLFAELINTSMEALVNMQAVCYNSFAKIAKDIAAGAVLITAVSSVIIAVFLFRDIEGWLNVVHFFCCNPLVIILLIFTIGISFIFIKGVKK